MSLKSDIDKRFEALRERQAATKLAGQGELEQWRADLAEAKAALQHEMADAAAGFGRKLREAEEAVTPLIEAHEALARAISQEERRIKWLRKWLGWVGLGVAGVAAATLAIALWVSQLTVERAETEAAHIRTENAATIAAARAEGEAAMAALSVELEHRESELNANLTAMGTELAQIVTDRDAARADLDRFIELRDQIGFELVTHHNGKVLIVAPENTTIQPWSALGLSSLARLNGRMWRVVAN